MGNNGEINADFSKLVIVHTADMEWEKLPGLPVSRKLIWVAGEGEGARVTQVLRYDAGAKLPARSYPGGEEIFVVEGTLSDEHGDYQANTHIFNPPGFESAPGSKDGCVVLSKLNMYPGKNGARKVTDTRTADWVDFKRGDFEIGRAVFFHKDDVQDMHLGRLHPGADADSHVHPIGEEIFVVEGGMEDAYGVVKEGTFVRYPVGLEHAPRTDIGCTFYVWEGHANVV